MVYLFGPLVFYLLGVVYKWVFSANWWCHLPAVVKMGTWVIAGGCEEWGWVGCTLEGRQDRSWQMEVNTAVLAVNKTKAPFLADLCWIAKHFMIKQIPMIWNLNTQLVCYSDPHCIMCTRKTDVITSLVSERSHSLHNCSHFNAFFDSN